MSDENVQLSQEQQDLILDLWNRAPSTEPPSLIFLVEKAWGEGVDPRSKKGRLVRDFLATRKLKPRLARQEGKEIELSETDKLYIKNNCATMKAVEIARVLFANASLTNLHSEARAVAKYLQTLTVPKIADDNVALEDYKPPITVPQTIARINTYIRDEIEESKLTGKQRKDLKALMGYLHTYRFQHQINSFAATNDRALFESEFIRCTYDKHDLTEEEVDQYIMYATEVVMSKNILHRIATLENIQDEEMDENKKMNMAIVEAVKTLRQDYKASIKTQNDLLSALKVKRSERLSTAQKDNASILNLVQLWKEEENRKDMIRIAQKRQVKLSDDIDRINSMDELKAKIMGISKDEALYG